ncbi:MAG: hypothetical protein QM820_29485 [Minicystis sp.]
MHRPAFESLRASLDLYETAIELLAGQQVRLPAGQEGPLLVAAVQAARQFMSGPCVAAGFGARCNIRDIAKRHDQDPTPEEARWTERWQRAYCRAARAGASILRNADTRLPQLANVLTPASLEEISRARDATSDAVATCEAREHAEAEPVRPKAKPPSAHRKRAPTKPTSSVPAASQSGKAKDPKRGGGAK